jgi:hypothetical protein
LSCQIKIIPLLLTIFASFWFSNRKAGWFLFFAAVSGLLWLEPLLTVPGPLLSTYFSTAVTGDFGALLAAAHRPPGIRHGRLRQFTSRETFVNGVLKLFIIAGAGDCVATTKCGRPRIVESLAYALIVFLFFSCGLRSISGLACAIRARAFAVAFRASVVEQLIISLFSTISSLTACREISTFARIRSGHSGPSGLGRF